jgi:hypothetical protein
MPARLLDNRDFREFISFVEPNRFIPVQVATFANRLKALPAEITHLSEPASKHGACMKGVAYAIGLETAAVLCVYGVWQFWQVLR